MRFHAPRVFGILSLLLLAAPELARAAPILQFTMGGQTWCELTTTRQCGIYEPVAFQFRIDPDKITLTRDVDLLSGLIYGNATFVLEDVTPLDASHAPITGSASYRYQIDPLTGQASIAGFIGSFYGSGWGREFAIWDTVFRVSAADLDAAAYWGWNTGVFEYYDWLSTPQGSLGHVGAVSLTSVEPVPEPATLYMVGGGLMAALARFRYRNRKRALQ